MVYNFSYMKLTSRGFSANQTTIYNIYLQDNTSVTLQKVSEHNPLVMRVSFPVSWIAKGKETQDSLHSVTFWGECILKLDSVEFDSQRLPRGKGEQMKRKPYKAKTYR